ncbi:MAG TPA: DMT family transporter [Burkholderiales bacterium]|nr:DMT family transporter [Burkholderiales bacterium]
MQHHGPPARDAAVPGRLGWLLLVATPAMMASSILVARLAAGWIPPMQLTFWRWLLAGLLGAALGFPLLRRNAPQLWREWPALLLLGAVGMTLCGSTAYLAGQTSTALNMALIYASSPVLMVLLARAFLDEPLGAARAAGIALCLAGIGAILSRGNPAALAAIEFNRGDLWAASGSVGWAVYSLLLKRLPTRLDLHTRFVGLSAAAALTAAPLALIEAAHGASVPVTPAALGLLAFTVVIGSYVVYVSYARLQVLAGVGFAGLTVYLSPLYAALYGWLFIHEDLHGYHLAGVALTLPGIWLAGRR